MACPTKGSDVHFGSKADIGTPPSNVSFRMLFARRTDPASRLN
jgi:hypothetical protein